MLASPSDEIHTWKLAVQFAKEEAQSLRHSQLETEHLLLGALRSPGEEDGHPASNPSCWHALV